MQYAFKQSAPTYLRPEFIFKLDLNARSNLVGASQFGTTGARVYVCAHIEE